MNPGDMEVVVKATGEKMIVTKAYYETYKDLFETKQSKGPSKNKMDSGSKKDK